MMCARRWVVAASVVALFGCSDKERTIVREASPTATSEPTATEVAPSATTEPIADTPTPPVPATPTMEATPAGTSPGPMITHLGIAQADNRVIEPSGTDAAGRPIFEREIGTGLNLIVEARAGVEGRPVGRSAFAEMGLPDLQVLVSRPLGDGSTAVCDVDVDGVNGGVPAVDPPVFSDAPEVVDAINDLGCRVNDGEGAPLARDSSGEACTIFEDGSFAFVDASSQAQYCLPIARAWAFPQGDTIVAVRVRSVTGNLGDTREIVVRILRELPPLPTRVPSPTPTPNPPAVTFVGVAAADDLILSPSGVDSAGRDVFTRLIGHGMTLVIEAAAGGSRGVGQIAYSDDAEAPDLQVLVSRDLGDGNPEVCDVDIENRIFGGIPATAPLEFSDDATTIAAMNDAGCRVNDGTGEPRGRNEDSPCTRDRFGNFTFVDARTETQFCLPIARAWQFQPGDTVVAVRVRSVDGVLSTVREIVVRVEGDGREDCEVDGLGARVFSIDPNGTGLFVAQIDGDVSSPWIGEPALLCAGAGDEGVHPLRLLRDVRFGAEVGDGSATCVKLFAGESEGVLDCAGSLGHGVVHSEDSDSGEIELMTGLGAPAGTGAATLRVPVAFRILPAPAAASDCFDANFGAASPIALTTGTAEAVVTNAVQGGTVELSVAGEPFDCQRWRNEDGPGKLAMPVPSTLDSVIGDAAVVFVFDD